MNAIARYIGRAFRRVSNVHIASGMAMTLAFPVAPYVLESSDRCQLIVISTIEVPGMRLCQA